MLHNMFIVVAVSGLFRATYVCQQFCISLLENKDKSLKFVFRLVLIYKFFKLALLILKTIADHLLIVFIIYSRQKLIFNKKSATH